MVDFRLESWEREPIWLKLLTPFLRKMRFPEITDNPLTNKWYRIYAKGCVDANGEKTYASFQLGTENKLLVFFAGGGVSWNEYTAARQVSLYNKNPREGFYMVHIDLISDLGRNKGIFEDSEHNPFRNWSKLVINYNTGDFHAGDGDYSYTALDGSKRIVHHHGFRNYMSIIKEVKKFIEQPETLLISGCSGGAFGVSLVSDNLINQYSKCQNIICLVDSGYFKLQDWRDISENVWHSPIEISRNLHSENIMLDGMNALYQKYGNKVKFLFCCSIRDGSLVRLMNYIHHGQLDYSLEGGEKLHRELATLSEELRMKIPTIGLYFFDKPDRKLKDMKLTVHCIISEKAVYEYRVSGKSAMDWLKNAVEGNVEQIGLHLLDVENY